MKTENNNKDYNIKALAMSIVRYELFVIYNAPFFIIKKEADLMHKKLSKFNGSNEVLKNAIEDVVASKIVDSIGYPSCNNCINAEACKDFMEDKKACEIYLADKECCDAHINKASALINRLRRKYNIDKNSIKKKTIPKL